MYIDTTMFSFRMVMQQNWSRTYMIFIFIIDIIRILDKLLHCVVRSCKRNDIKDIRCFCLQSYLIQDYKFRVVVALKRDRTFVISSIFPWTASCEAEINVKTGSVQLGFLGIKLATLSEARGVFPGR